MPGSTTHPRLTGRAAGRAGSPPRALPERRRAVERPARSDRPPGAVPGARVAQRRAAIAGSQPGRAPRPARSRGEAGSVLLLALLGLTLLALAALALAQLGALEADAASASVRHAEAEVLAAGGLDHAVAALAGAAGEPCGFTRWTSAAAIAGCGSPLGALVLDRVGLGSGEYSVVVDNDCGPVLPAAIPTDPACAGPTPGRDGNDTAVLTAFATSGPARARVRALVLRDTAWAHVCAGHRGDARGWCREDAPVSGATLTPADPGDPAGPRAFADLPRPLLGCSRVDPTLHRRAGEDAAAQSAGCAAFPEVYAAPYPAGPGVPRLALMGPDPATVAGAPRCDGGGQGYFGYFDCALTTPCPAAVCGVARKACVRAGDVRAVTAPGLYVEAGSGGCPVEAGTRQTGLVFQGDVAWSGVSLGGPGSEVTVYVAGGRVAIDGGTIWGTVVAEGTGGTGCDAAPAVRVGPAARLWAGPGGAPGLQYGYPLALLLYDPAAAMPTAAGDPQPGCLALGAAPGASEVHGLVYSAGPAAAGAVTLDGGLVAFRLESPGAGTRLRFGPAYAATPPPGFPRDTGSRVAVIRKSVTACATYADDRAGGSVCP